MKDYQLGILLVHGIGSQRLGETLVHWGDALVKVIEQATKREITASVRSSTLNNDVDAGRAEAVVELRHKNGETEKWLLSETWWAQAFPAMTYQELVSWSVRAVPWALALHIAQKYWTARREAASTLVRVTQFLKTFGLLLFVLALAPLFVLILGFTLLLGLLPIAQLRAAILSVQSILTASVGDCLAFVESPLRAALIRTRISNDFANLEPRCKQTVVLAHSQGAAAALDALGGIMRSPSEESPSDANTKMPNTLLTFGAGINQLASLRMLSAGLPKPKAGAKTDDKDEGFELNPVYLGIGALFVTLIFSAMIYSNIHAGKSTLLGTLLAVLVLPAAMFGILSMFLLLGPPFKWLSQKWQWLNRHAKVISLVTYAIACLAAIAGMLFVEEKYHLPLSEAQMLLVALIALGIATALIFSASMLRNVSAMVHKPQSLEHWIDLYASADPVPNGPTRMKDNSGVRSYPIWNRGSLFGDHTSYWENLDGFVLRVVRACAAAAESKWENLLPKDTTSIDERARWRAGFLGWARFFIAVLGLVFLVQLWTRYGETIWVPFDLDETLAPWALSLLRFTLLTVAVLLAVSIYSGLATAVWRIGSHGEQVKVLENSHPSGVPISCVFGLGLVVTIPVGIALALRRQPLLIGAMDGSETWFGFATSVCVMFFGFAVLYGMLMLLFRRVPTWKAGAESSAPATEVPAAATEA